MSELAALWPVPDLVLPRVGSVDGARVQLIDRYRAPGGKPPSESDRIPIHWPLTIKERDTDDDRDAAALLGAIFRAHYSELFALVHRYVRSRALTEEIIQDAFLAVWKRRPLWAANMDVKAYVFRTAHNRALNHLRRDRVEIDWQRLVAERREEWGMSQYASDARLTADVNETIELMQHAVGRLPKRVRRTIILRLHFHLTNAEIAEVMGISTKAVERNITRGLKALRQTLGPRR